MASGIRLIPFLGEIPSSTAQGIVVTQETLERLARSRPTLFRLPRVRPRRDIWRAVRREGITPIHASVVSLSESSQSPRSLRQKIVGRVKNGDIVLLHGWPGAAKPPVVRALPGTIEGLEEKGFELGTIPELLNRARKNF